MKRSTQSRKENSVTVGNIKNMNGETDKLYQDEH